MPRNLAVILAAVAALCIWGAWPNRVVPRTARAGEYLDPLYNFALIPPAGWEKEAELHLDGRGKTVAFYCPLESDSDIFQEGISIVTEKLPYELTPEKYAEISNKNAVGYVANLKITRTAAATIGKLPAVREECTFTRQSVPLRGLIYIVVEDYVAYTIMCAAQPHTYYRYLPLFEKVCHSFQLD